MLKPSLQSHITSLRRFFIRYARSIQREELSEAQNQPQPPDSKALFSATESGGHYHAFQLSTARRDADSFGQLSRWIAKQKSHELKLSYLKIAEEQLALARKRLGLDREKMELNASRMALKNMLKLQEIYRTQGIDDEAKIRAARIHLFGSAPA